MRLIALSQKCHGGAAVALLGVSVRLEAEAHVRAKFLNQPPVNRCQPFSFHVAHGCSLSCVFSAGSLRLEGQVGPHDVRQALFTHRHSLVLSLPLPSHKCSHNSPHSSQTRSRQRRARRSAGDVPLTRMQRVRVALVLLLLLTLSHHLVCIAPFHWVHTVSFPTFLTVSLFLPLSLISRFSLFLSFSVSA